MARYKQAKNMYVSDILNTPENSASMKNRMANGESYIFDAGTGNGKTTSIKTLANIAAQIGKRTLVLVHRISIRQDMKKELRKNIKAGMITLMSYQKFNVVAQRKNMAFCESDMENVVGKLPKTINDFGLIICDEAHCFVSDSGFAKDLAYAIDVLVAHKASKIYMSATHSYELLRSRLEDKGKPLRAIHFGSASPLLVDIKTMLNNDGQIELVLKEVAKGNKVIWMINNTKQIATVKENIEARIASNKKLAKRDIKVGTTYSKSKKAKDANGLVNSIADFDSIENHAQLHSDILLTTSVLSTGVNIKDPKLTMIVANTIDSKEIIQLAGRARTKTTNRSVKLYVPTTKSRLVYEAKRYNNVVECYNNKLPMTEDGQIPTPEQYIKAKEQLEVITPVIEGKRTFVEQLYREFFAGHYSLEAIGYALENAATNMIHCDRSSRVVERNMVGALLCFAEKDYRRFKVVFGRLSALKDERKMYDMYVMMNKYYNEAENMAEYCNNVVEYLKSNNIMPEFNIPNLTFENFETFVKIVDRAKKSTKMVFYAITTIADREWLQYEVPMYSDYYETYKAYSVHSKYTKENLIKYNE